MKVKIGQYIQRCCDCCGKNIQYGGKNLEYLFCSKCHRSKLFLSKQIDIKNLTHQQLIECMKEKTELLRILRDKRRRHNNMITEIKKIADKCRKEIGFINRAILQKALDENRVLIVKNENNEIGGFLHYYLRKRDDIITVYELAVSTDLRGKGYGKQLIEALKEKNKIIQLKCPVDNSSNGFYEHQGFQLIEISKGRKRMLNLWRWFPSR